MTRLAGFTTAAVAALVLAVSAVAQPLDADSLLEAPTVLDVDLSPDGERIVLIVRDPASGNYRIAVRHIDDGATAFIPLGDVGVTPMWVTWATNDRLLLAVFTDFIIDRRRISFPSARIIAIDADGTDAVLMFDDQQNVMRSNINLASITNLLPQDPAHVLMPGRRGGDLDLWRVNIFTGEADRIALGVSATIGWITDREGAPRLRIDSNRRGTVISIYAPPEDDGRRWRRVARVREEDRLEFQPVAAAEDVGAFYTVVRPEGEDRAALFVYDAVSGALVQRVAENGRVDISGVVVEPRTGRFAGYFYIDDRIEYRFEEERVQQHFDAVREFLGDDANVRIYDQSGDGERWILQVSGPREPGGFYVYNLESTEMEMAVATRTRLARDRFAPTSVVRYQSRDGMDITGYLTTPLHRVAEDLPLIVMPHGGPEARDMLDFSVYTQFLASRGYAVFQPNFRGSSGYGRAFAEAGRGEWGAAMQDDLADGVDHLAQLGVVDPNRVCVIGASYGGYAALAAVTLTPDRYRCAVSIAGVSDLEDFLRYVRRSDLHDRDEYDYWVAQIGDPSEQRDVLRARSPRRLLGSLDAPVLLIHGARDATVPIEQSEDMADELSSAGKVHQFVELEGVGHSNWPAQQEAEALAHIDKFLTLYLPVR